jgi:KaiC/GvpD/RAD55 family RecA-like ATPase
LIRFGIPTLDFLIGVDPNRHSMPAQGGLSQHQSVCIVGPPGTSKSILAMHLASTFYYRHPDALVFYVSTDWGDGLAQQCVQRFKLDNYHDRIVNPYNRFRPRDYPYLSIKDGGEAEVEKMEMKILGPERQDFEPTLQSLLSSTGKRRFGFLDLRSNTAGDDWRQILHLATFAAKKIDEERAANPHVLFVIDAVEGLELLAGDRDQFGLRRTRRQRIAQLARVMGTHAFALVVEDKTVTPDAYDEEFITDVVLRVNFRNVHGYLERTVQVTKCRSTTHQLGVHPLLLRDGSGSRASIGDSDEWLNYDDPFISYDPEEELVAREDSRPWESSEESALVKSETSARKSQSYVYVIPSIHSRSASLISGKRGGL